MEYIGKVLRAEQKVEKAPSDAQLGYFIMLVSAKSHGHTEMILTETFFPKCLIALSEGGLEMLHVLAPCLASFALRTSSDSQTLPKHCHTQWLGHVLGPDYPHCFILL